MTYIDGEIVVRSEEEWLNRMLVEGQEYWGENIVNNDNSAIHEFYRPYAARLNELESELREVSQSLKINEATGDELDRLGQRYGINRKGATKATGVVTFQRSSSQDGNLREIPENLVVQTTDIGPLRFVTRESAGTATPSGEVDIKVEALESGSKYNISTGQISDAVSLPVGFDSLINKNPVTGGNDGEEDEEYRRRIKDSLGKTETASAFNIYNALKSREFVNDVVYADSKASYPTTNLAPSDFEVTVDANITAKDEIAQIIFENSPMGANPVGGNRGEKVIGEASLPNGQTFDIPFSIPETVQVGVYADLTTTSPVSTETVVNQIVSYIGGTDFDGNEVSGKLTMGEDVIKGNVDYHIRDIEQVKDVFKLKIGNEGQLSDTFETVGIAKGQKAEINLSNIYVTQ